MLATLAKPHSQSFLAIINVIIKEFSEGHAVSWGIWAKILLFIQFSHAELWRQSQFSVFVRFVHVSNVRTEILDLFFSLGSGFDSCFAPAGAGLHRHAGLGRQPPRSHRHHQGDAGLQPREGTLDRAGRSGHSAGEVLGTRMLPGCRARFFLSRRATFEI